ncbi:hypothetical protein ACLKA6_015929 [Drosophila palustris]
MATPQHQPNMSEAGESKNPGMGVSARPGFASPRDQTGARSSSEVEPLWVIAKQVRKWGMRFDGQTDPLEFLETLQERAITDGFVEFFLPPDYLERLEEEIRSRRQRNGEGFKDFLIDIKVLMHHAGYSAAQELHRVYENAAPDYKLYVRRQDFSTLSQLTRMAAEYESLRDYGVYEEVGIGQGRHPVPGRSMDFLLTMGTDMQCGYAEVIPEASVSPAVKLTRRAASAEELSPVPWSSPQSLSDQSSSRTNEASGTLRDQPNSSRAVKMAETEARVDVGLGREYGVVEEQVGRRTNTDESESPSEQAMVVEWPENPGPELKEFLEAELINAPSRQGKHNEVVEALLRHPLEICAQTVEAEPTCKQIASMRARIAEEPAHLSVYPETDDQPGWNPGCRADYEGNQTERKNSTVKASLLVDFNHRGDLYDQSQQYNIRTREWRPPWTQEARRWVFNLDEAQFPSAVAQSRRNPRYPIVAFVVVWLTSGAPGRIPCTAPWFHRAVPRTGISGWPVYVLVGILTLATISIWILKKNSVTFTLTPLDTVVTPAMPSFAMPSLWPSFHVRGGSYRLRFFFTPT